MVQKLLPIYRNAIQFSLQTIAHLFLIAFLLLICLLIPANSSVVQKTLDDQRNYAAPGDEVGQFIIVHRGKLERANYKWLAQSKALTPSQKNRLQQPVNREIFVAAVPELRGLKVRAAKKRIAEYKLTIEVAGKNYSDYKRGTIFKQDPIAGSKMPKDGRIKVWKSLGPARVPNLLGQTLKDARNKIDSRLKLRIERADKDYSEKKKGLIYQQDPQPNASIPRGRVLKVWISLGPLRAPNLLDKTLDGARKSIHAKSYLGIQEAGRDYSEENQGLIYHQEPQPNAEISPGDSIRVWISLGTARVPNVLGKTLDGAKQSVDSRLKLSVEAAGWDYNEEGQGLIFRQDPLPNTDIPKDRRIRVWLSRGPKPLATVPDLSGMTPREAEARYQNLPLYTHIIGKEPSQAKRDTIVSQDPEPGAPMPQDSRINVQVSLGISPQIPVPDIRGLTPNQAEARHRKLNLRVHIVGEAHADAQVNTIIAQVPEPGSPMPEDSRIKVKTSLGEQLRVPDLLGLTTTEAMSTHRNLNLALQIKDEEDSDQKAGTIIRQLPEPGVPMDDTRRVDVWLSKSKVILMPDLVGLTTVEADSLIKDLQLAIQVAGRENSTNPIETIIRQIPAPGTNLPADRFINVWLSLGGLQETEKTNYWPFVIIGGGAILIFGGIGLFVKIMRAKPSEPSKTEPPSSPKTPSLNAKANLDPGEQKVETERDIIKSPAVSLRIHPDGGRQSIELSKTSKEE
jgi:beta-lactam-binding protein with PASTA domain